VKQGNLRGAIPWKVNEDGNPHHCYYSFDTGVCLSGLADLYTATGEKQYWQSAVMAADWLISQAQNDDGSYKAVFDRTQNIFDRSMLQKYWSGDKGSLHIKNIRGLIKAYEITRNEEYLKSIRKTMSWSRNIQNEEGFFPASQGIDLIFTHAHCYAIEGIISAFIYFNDAEYRGQILAAADWLLKAQNSDGSFYDYYHLPNIFLRLISSDSRVKRLYHGVITVDSQKIFRIKRTDAASQGARILAFSYLLTQKSRYKRAGLKALDFINKMQSGSPNKNETGGIRFGRLDLIGIKRKSRLYTSWSGMFAANAMYLLGQIQDKRNIDPAYFNEQLF
jgi:rhamnogalacturonyl hydrolase YesR